MILKRMVLGRGFSTPEEAVAPLARALQAREDVVGAVTAPISIFTCFAPTYGRWGGRFRYQARVSVHKDVRSVVTFELERSTLTEAAHIAVIFAFWMLLIGLGGHRYLGLGVGLAIFSTAVRLLFLVAGANRLTEVFPSAYATEEKEPNQPPQPMPLKPHGSS